MGDAESKLMKNITDAMGDPSVAIVDIKGSGVRVRIRPVGFDYPSVSDVRYMRVLFHLEIMPGAPARVFLEDWVQGLQFATLSFTLDMKESLKNNILRFRHFASKHSESLLAEGIERSTRWQLRADARIALRVVLACSLFSLVLATVILVFPTYGAIVRAASSAIAVLGGGMAAVATHAFRRGRNQQYQDEWSLRQRLRSAFSPWKETGISRGILKQVESMLEVTDDVVSPEKIDILLRTDEWPAELVPQFVHRLGDYLGQVSRVLEPHADKCTRFRRVLDDVLSRYQRDSSLPLTLISLADTFEWPRWAVETLPSLFLSVQELSGKRLFLAWWPIVEYMKALAVWRNRWETRRIWCSGAVLEVESDQEVYEILEKSVAIVFEKLRKDSPYSSSSATKGLILAALDTLEEEDREEGRLENAESLAVLRSTMFREDKIGYLPPGLEVNPSLETQ